ncbi:FAD-NAD(P)-binding protein [Erwinia sorbitola]|uniref:FAD-NAD(P)-binding protein n=1 Tax=Erwinia sorbitola TaxID=2681984 RepID=A0A6I6EDK3_9GAMM|nr:FAD-NAD(P)-binding protein [Erwinia sorbitola]MTD25531.1 FAD-NAD(P)-binding protein [Erwinia sorbitola]QGU87907.1 FAD-NAD(P)-binding protein [Erwinia sorbitola]
MKTIAIIGAGPMGIYTLYSLLNNKEPLSIVVYEQSREAGVGMPYSNEENSRMMLANIASIEIPPVFITYIEWLRTLSDSHLARYGVDAASLHIRQFLPRILLGEYFRDRFLALVEQARRQGFSVEVHENCEVTDLEATDEGVRLWAEGEAAPVLFDLAVIATGHVWPDESEATRTYFPSPWSGLMEATIPAANIGVMGTSLSGIDAAMAVVLQHGEFAETDDQQIKFTLDRGSEALKITLMSRSGILPEADFYCPIPYEPLTIVTQSAIENAIAAGSAGLLERIFRLMVEEIEAADPEWSRSVSLRSLDVDSFSEAWFADRHKHDPFHWARANLDEVERNKRDRRTVAWRYVILRLHEVIEEIVPFLDERDSKRFNSGIARVFIDNYAAIPSQSIRRLLALHDAGVISILALGHDYHLQQKEAGTVIFAEGKTCQFDLFIDARGQQPLATKDLPFATLRKQLLAAGNEIPEVGDNYTLLAPNCARGRIAFGALPYLMHDRPFVQGITVCAEIGAAIGRAVSASPFRTRRRLPFIEL